MNTLQTEVELYLADPNGWSINYTEDLYFRVSGQKVTPCNCGGDKEVKIRRAVNSYLTRWLKKQK